MEAQQNLPLLAELQQIAEKRSQSNQRQTSTPKSEVGKFLQNFVEQTSQHKQIDSQTQSQDNSCTEETRIMKVKSSSKDRDLSSTHKHVRFSIIDGIKHVMKESNIDLDQVSQRSGSLNQNSQVQQQNKIGTTRLSSRSKSPKVELKFQKPPQPVVKNNKLALQYKRNAEESRKKKGIEVILQSSSNQTVPNQTPNFSVLIKQQEPDQQQKSPDKTRPLPSPIIKPIIQIEPVKDINNLKQLQQQKQITNQDQNLTQIAGTILKRNDNSRQRDLSQSSHLSKQPGQILRQRSTSPGDIFILGRNKENLSVMMNSNIKAGQILRQQPNPLNQSVNIFPTQKLIENNIQRSQHLESSFHCMTPKEPQTPQTQISNVRKFQNMSASQQAQQQNIDQIQNNVEYQQREQFDVIWNLLKGPVSLVHNKLQEQQENQHIQASLIKQLNITLNGKQQNFNNINDQSKRKMRLIRHILRVFHKDHLMIQTLQIAELKSKLEQRKQDLKVAIRLANISTDRQKTQDKLKIEILKDICSRLTQKIVIKAIHLSVLIKKSVISLFNQYHSNYIARDYKMLAFHHLKQYHKNKNDKQNYDQYGKVHIKQLRRAQIFNAWRYIKQFKNRKLDKLRSALAVINSRKVVRIMTEWKIVIIQKRNKDLGNQIVQKRLELKLQSQLFLKWVKQHRMQSKIKRKAALMVNQPRSQQINILQSDEAFKLSMQKTEEQFFSGIQEVLLEREHNKTFMTSLKYKISPNQLESEIPYSNEEQQEQYQNINRAKLQNNSKIYKQFPQLKNMSGSPIKFSNIMKETRFDSPSAKIKKSTVTNSMDDDSIGIKYSIHSALVQQQNFRQNIDQNMSTNQSQINYQRPKQIVYKQLIPPMPQRILAQEQSAEANLSQILPAPNKFYEKLENQLQQLQSKKKTQLTSYQDKHSYLPLKIQIIDHAQQLKQFLNVLKDLPVEYHFSVSLKSHSKITDSQGDVLYGVSDYIQYGLSSSESRMTFINLAQKRSMSKLFTQWKVKFLKKWLNHDIQQINWLNQGKYSLKAWKTIVKSREQRATEYYQTKKMQKFYRIFQRWADSNRNIIFKDIQAVRLFRKRIVFNFWLNYLEKQGFLLQKILRAQQYYQQALMSKALLSMYQGHLKAIRIKKFRSKKIFRKFFKKIWLTKYRRQKVLKKILGKLSNQHQFQDRLKYQRQYEMLKVMFVNWKKRVGDKKEVIQDYSATNHYKQSLISKYFFKIKDIFTTTKGFNKLNQVAQKMKYKAFYKIKYLSNQLVETQHNWESYRSNYLQSQVLMRWREQAMQTKLANMFFKRRMLKSWFTYIQDKNYNMPRRYYQQKIQAVFINNLKSLNREKWNQQRFEIISKSMIKNRREKIMKIIFLKLLENILVQKKKRIIKSTIIDFQQHNLKEKTFVSFKNYIKAKQRNNIQDYMAKNLYIKFLKRRQTKQQNLYERKRYVNMTDEQVLQSRVISSWHIYSQEQKQKRIVFDRYMRYKARMTLVRCLLSWRSVARYEQSLKSSSNMSANPFNMPLAYPNHHMSNNNLNKKTYSSQQHAPQIQSLDNIMPKSNQTLDKGPQHDNQQMSKAELATDKSLFDELEHIFTKNKKWLDEQKEREDFLREMATHYNQTLSNEMSSLRYSTEQLTTLKKKASNTRF